jgi:hypothetical protein
LLDRVLRIVLLSPKMSKCRGEGWAEIGGCRVQEVELGFISGACGEKKSLEKKFVSMNEKVLSDVSDTE